MRRFFFPLALLAVAAFCYVMAQVSDSDAGSASPAGPPDQVVSTPTFSARRVPTFISTPIADAALVDELNGIVASSPPETCLVVARNRRPIFSHNGDTAVIPASAQKVVTGAALLEALGRDFTFRTQASAVSTISAEGVLEGDLWLIGGGDPVLATPDYIARYPEAQTFTDLTELAQTLVQSGLTQINGAVVGDETRYDDIRYIPSWPARFTNQTDNPQNQTGPLSALSVNDAFQTYPTDSDANSLARAADDPAAQAAADFDDALEALGVTIVSSARSGTAPGGLNQLAELTSPPLHEIVGQMLASSDNSTAELLVKELGLADSGTPSTDAGVAAMQAILEASGAIMDGVSIADGSGLSSENRVTCDHLIDLLDDSGPDGDLAAGLAIGGETGTLRERFLDNAATGRIFAKTGSLNEVSALVGFADTKTDETLTFAYIANQPELDGTASRATQERMGLDLVAWPEAPPIADLDPEPARVGG